MYPTFRSDSSLHSHKTGMPRMRGSQFVAPAQQSFDISTERPIKLYFNFNYY